MYDLLICEDKPVILMGLQKLAAGFDLPIGQIYLAEDGQQALQIFSQQKIRLVMTDIRMPNCDGLQLLRRMQQIRSDFQSIIISGYNDFSYAKTAIQLGIEDYLLKPVDPDELCTSLARCIQNLTRHTSQTQILSGILLDQMREVWGDSLPEEAISSFLSTEDSFFQAAPFGFLAFHFENSTLPPAAIHEKLRAFLSEIFTHYLVFPVYTNFFCAVINLSMAEERTYCSLPRFLETFLRQCRDIDSLPLSCGIGPASESIFQLKDTAIKAEAALYNRFAVTSSLTYLWETSAICPPKIQSQILHCCDSLCRDLRLPEIAALEKDVCNLFSKFRTVPTSVQMIPECLRNIESFIRQELGETFKAPSLLSAGDSAGTLDQLESRTQQELLNFCRQRLKSRWVKQDAISLAIEYMEQNYHKPLTLTILANVVSLNYTYFSSIFKNRTGMSVIAYLQNLRIQKAKELLISSDEKICEIAHKTGFTDERYFEKLFKQCEKLTHSVYQ